jgi:hypothetical protein
VRYWDEVAAMCGMGKADVLHAALREYAATFNLPLGKKRASLLAMRALAKRASAYQESLTAEEKSERGRKAVQARWAKAKKKT